MKNIFFFFACPEVYKFFTYIPRVCIFRVRVVLDFSDKRSAHLLRILYDKRDRRSYSRDATIDASSAAAILSSRAGQKSVVRNERLIDPTAGAGL